MVFAFLGQNIVTHTFQKMQKHIGFFLGKTLHQFGCGDLPELAKRLQLWALRIDYGFDRWEIISLAEKMPIVLNASTVTAEDARTIAGEGREVFAMHNFYPRPETGLDEDAIVRWKKGNRNNECKYCKEKQPAG